MAHTSNVFTLTSRPVGSMSVFINPKESEGPRAGNDKLGVPYRFLNNDDLRREFPMLRLPDSTVAIHEKHSGLLHADKALQSFQVCSFDNNSNVLPILRQS